MSHHEQGHTMEPQPSTGSDETTPTVPEVNMSEQEASNGNQNHQLSINKHTSFKGVRVMPQDKHKLVPPIKCIEKNWVNYRTFVLKLKVDGTIQTHEIKLGQCITFVGDKKTPEEFQNGVIVDLEHMNKKYMVVVLTIGSLDGKVSFDDGKIIKIVPSQITNLYKILRKEDEEALNVKLSSLGHIGTYYKNMISYSRALEENASPDIIDYHFHHALHSLYLTNDKNDVEKWEQTKMEIVKEINHEKNDVKVKSETPEKKKRDLIVMQHLILLKNIRRVILKILKSSTNIYRTISKIQIWPCKMLVLELVQLEIM